MITDRVIRISRWRGPSGKKNGQGNFSLFLQVSNPGVLGPPSFCVLSFTDFLIVLLVPKKSSATPYQIINVQQYHMLTTWSICHQGQNIIHQAFLMSKKFQNRTLPPPFSPIKYLHKLSILLPYFLSYLIVFILPMTKPNYNLKIWNFWNCLQMLYSAIFSS